MLKQNIVKWCTKEAKNNKKIARLGDFFIALIFTESYNLFEQEIFIQIKEKYMKKIFVLGSILALAACGMDAKYQETGLVCENAAGTQTTLDVKATDTTANVVVNGEKIVLTAEPQQEGSNMVVYYGTNANNEKVKLNIVSEENGVKYMLGVNADETTYGCVKPVIEEKPAEEAKTEEAAK